MTDVTNFDPADLEENPQIGDNKPPADADPLRDSLYETYSEDIKRRAELLAAFDRAPETIEDEQTQQKMADFLSKQIAAFLKKQKSAHDTDKEPFLKAGRTVDNFWHFLIDDIVVQKVKLEKAVKAYADRKAAAEKRAREEAERQARAAAEEARRKAEAAQAEAERQVREAQERAAAAERKLAEERAQRKAEEDARIKLIKDEKQLERELVAQAELKAAMEEEDRLRETLALKAKDDAKQAEAEAHARAQEAEDEAKRAESEALKAAKSAQAKPAEMGKSRGEYGGQISLKRFWNFTNLDRDTIDLEALRDHFTTEAVEKALRSWRDAHKDDLAAGKTLKGVRFFEDTRL